MIQSKNVLQKEITPITPHSIIENPFGESRKTSSPKPNDSLCKLCKELFESIPYVLNCWLKTVTTPKTTKYYLSSEYSKSLEKLIKIFNKTRSKDTKKDLYDRIQIIAFQKIKNVEESNDALELKNKIDKIDPTVYNGSTLLHNLIEALKLRCIEKNVEIKITIPFDKKRSSSIYLKN